MSWLGVPVSWWDGVWPGTLLVAIGDVLVLVGAGVAWSIYRRQSRASDCQMKRASLAQLRGVKAALAEWHGNFFSTSYEGKAADERAEMDAKLINEGNYMQNYMVPTSPVASLTDMARATWPFEPETVRAANVALARMTVFNQLVQKQTDFLAQHAADIVRLGGEHRVRIAEAAKRISRDLHSAIGDNKWYVDLTEALDANIGVLGGSVDASEKPS